MQNIVRKTYNIYSGEVRTDLPPDKKFGAPTEHRRTWEEVKSDTRFALRKKAYYGMLYDTEFATYIASQQEVDDVFNFIVFGMTPENFNPKIRMFEIPMI